MILIINDFNSGLFAGVQCAVCSVQCAVCSVHLNIFRRFERTQLYSFFHLGAGCGWVVDATPRPLYPRERPYTLCIGGWVVPRVGLDGCGKSRPNRDSIRRPSSCPVPAQVSASIKKCWVVVQKLCSGLKALNGVYNVGGTL
jgi:hypothetical protein